jgi:hypothetical protein
MKTNLAICLKSLEPQVRQRLPAIAYPLSSDFWRPSHHQAIADTAADLAGSRWCPGSQMAGGAVMAFETVI